jgi:cytosine/adenosine deaminase-related metal-dependent hydrolase
MILRAKWLVDRSLRLIENGSITIGKNDEILDLGNSILMPGLVNAHCHLDYTDMVGLLHPKTHFSEWIREMNQIKRTWDQSRFERSIEKGLQESLLFGTTMLANWTCSPEWISPPNSFVPRIWWLWEQITLRTETGVAEWNQWSEKISGMSPHWKLGLAPHAPYTCSAGCIQASSEWSSERKAPWSIHVSESLDEMEMFTQAKGTLYELLKSFNRDMKDCGDRTPFQVVYDCLGKNMEKTQLLLIHANYLDEKDFEKLREIRAQGGNVAVVHCPRSHHYFGRDQFPIEKLREFKIPICLGTDSLASNEDLSMFGEMRMFRKRYPKIPPREVFEMATISGLEALGVNREWMGWSDWIGIPKSGNDVWEDITTFTGEPSFIMIDGQVYKNEK